MSFFRFFRRAPKSEPLTRPKLVPVPTPPILEDRIRRELQQSKTDETVEIRRYFHNQQHFQCYTSWFAHWGGWISAGHCLTEAQDHLPDFASGEFIKWPDGLDAALVDCNLPEIRPTDPVIGQDVIMKGFPAGSRTMESRTGRVYHQRMPGQYIAHIFEPDEPVVTGMSGGPVLDAKTGKPIGIIITRNSPADLNNDRDPDESADFIALSSVWDALKAAGTF